MIKFKVGDLVRIVYERYGHGFNIGQVVKITEVDNFDENCQYRAEGCGYYWFIADCEAELIQSNTLTVGNRYTSANGNKWECIAVKNDIAWLSGVFGSEYGAAYKFHIDGTPICLASGTQGYRIEFEPVRQSVSTRFSIGLSNRDAMDGVDNHVARITFDLVDGEPDWTTAKVTA